MATTYTYQSAAPAVEFFPGVGTLAPGEEITSPVELTFSNLVLVPNEAPAGGTGDTGAPAGPIVPTAAELAAKAAELQALEDQAAADAAAIAALKATDTTTTGAAS